MSENHLTLRLSILFTTAQVGLRIFSKHAVGSSLLFFSTGASPHEPLLATYSLISGSEVEMETKAKAKLCGCGNMNIATKVGNSISKCRRKNVLHIPDFEYSLILASITIKGVFILPLEMDAVRLPRAVEMLSLAFYVAPFM